MQPPALVKVIVPRSPLHLLTAKGVGSVKFKLPVVNRHCVSAWSPFTYNILCFKTFSKGLKAVQVRLVVLLLHRLAWLSSLFLKYRLSSTALRLRLQTQKLLKVIIRSASFSATAFRRHGCPMTLEY